MTTRVVERGKTLRAPSSPRDLERSWCAGQLSGVSALVAVKIFGPDLDRLRQVGIEVQTVAESIPGFEDCKLDQTSSITQLRIEVDRDRANAYGVAPGVFYRFGRKAADTAI